MSKKHELQKIKNHLIGKKIVKVERLSEEETTDLMWFDNPMCFELDDGTWIIPQSDDEGNNGGVAVLAIPDGDVYRHELLYTIKSETHKKESRKIWNALNAITNGAQTP